MIFQSRPYTCGPASIVNAMEALGSRAGLTERLAYELAETRSRKGTSVYGLKRALRKLGENPQVLKSKEEIGEALRAGAPVILCTEHDSHWVAVVGVLGDRWLVADSWKRKGRAAGIQAVWPRELQVKKYYGIALAH